MWQFYALDEVGKPQNANQNKHSNEFQKIFELLYFNFVSRKLSLWISKVTAIDIPKVWYVLLVRNL